MASDKNDNSSSSTSAWDKLDDFLTQQAQMMNELLKESSERLSQFSPKKEEQMLKKEESKALEDPDKTRTSNNEKSPDKSQSSGVSTPKDKTQPDDSANTGFDQKSFDETTQKLVDNVNSEMEKAISKLHHQMDAIRDKNSW